MGLGTRFHNSNVYIYIYIYIDTLILTMCIYDNIFGSLLVPQPSPVCHIIQEGSSIICVDIHMLGGSWVVISGVISPLICLITIVMLLITTLITTHEPPSMCVYPLS